MTLFKGTVFLKIIGRGCFRIEYSTDELDDGWIGKVPALPGCVSQGDTLAELLENIKDAIVGVLDLDEGAA